MTSREPDRTVRASVLDRLLDAQPREAADSPITFNESVNALKRSLLRDLEWLLNTRRIAEPAPDDYPELQRSVYHYGLPDITSLSGDDPTVRRRLVREVEECIRLFEPRLTAVEVEAVPVSEETRGQVRFVVRAILLMEPNPERVVFDTILDVSSGAFSLAGGLNA